MKPPPAREGEDRPGDHAIGLAHRFERRLEIGDPDHRQRRR